MNTSKLLADARELLEAPEAIMVRDKVNKLLNDAIVLIKRNDYAGAQNMLLTAGEMTTRISPLSKSRKAEELLVSAANQLSTLQS